MILAFYLMLSPCGAAYSLDARRASRRRGTLAEPLIVPWAQRLIQLQLCLVYFNTAVLKANGSTWLDGTALHFVLNNSEVGRFSLDPLTEYPLAINALTLGGLVVEFAPGLPPLVPRHPPLGDPRGPGPARRHPADGQHPDLRRADDRHAT